MTLTFSRRLTLVSLAVLASATGAHASVPIKAKCEFSSESGTFWRKEDRLSLTVDAILYPFIAAYGNKSNCVAKFNGIIDKIAAGQDATKKVVFRCAPDYDRYEITITSAEKIGGNEIVSANFWDGEASKFITTDLPQALRKELSSACPDNGGANVINPPITPPNDTTPRVDLTALYYSIVNPIRASSQYTGQNYVTGTHEKWSTCIERVIRNDLKDPLDDCRSQPNSGMQSCADTGVTLFKRKAQKDCTIGTGNQPSPPREKTCADFYNPYIGSKGAAEQAAAALIQNTTFSKDPKTCSGQIQKIRADAARAPGVDSDSDGRAFYSQNNIGSGHFCGFGSKSAIDTAITAYRAKIDSEYLKKPCPLPPEPPIVDPKPPVVDPNPPKPPKPPTNCESQRSQFINIIETGNMNHLPAGSTTHVRAVAAHEKAGARIEKNAIRSFCMVKPRADGRIIVPADLETHIADMGINLAATGNPIINGATTDAGRDSLCSRIASRYNSLATTANQSLGFFEGELPRGCTFPRYAASKSYSASGNTLGGPRHSVVFFKLNAK